MTETTDIEACYHGIIDAWNRGDPAGFASHFTDDASVIGYDGSPSTGRGQIENHLNMIFKDHKPGRFVTIVRGVQMLGREAAVLRAAVGVIPHSQGEIKPEVNFLQTMAAVRAGDVWRAALLQATPAQFHGRPEMSAQLTEELRHAAAQR